MKLSLSFLRGTKTTEKNLQSFSEKNNETVSDDDIQNPTQEMVDKLVE